MSHSNKFRPQPGEFCKAYCHVPSYVSTAVMSRESSKYSTPTSPPKKSRVVYVHSTSIVNGALLYNVHFCTGFSGNDMSTQYWDDTNKRDLYLSLFPTPAQHADAPSPLKISNPYGWDRQPAYLCLRSVSVVLHDTHRLQPTRALPHIPTLDPAERQRLDELIMAKVIQSQGQPERPVSSPNHPKFEQTFKSTTITRYVKFSIITKRTTGQTEKTR